MRKTELFYIFAVLANLFYLFASLFFFFFLDNSLMNKNNNDFLTYYEAGRLIITDVSSLYDISQYLYPFRYFPLSAYVFTPFSILGLELGYIFFQIFSFILNIALIYLIYKIIKIYPKLNNNNELKYDLREFSDVFNKPENESVLYHFAILLIMLPQFMNYFLGQINSLVSFFVLYSAYFFLKNGNKNNFLGGLMLGFGILIKPTLLLLIPFLVPLYYSEDTRQFVFHFKIAITRFLGTIILLIISSIYFLVSPTLLEGFMDVNFTGKYATTIGTLDINASFSLTRNLITFFQITNLNISNFIVFLVIILLFLVPILYYYIFSNNQPSKLIDGYLIGIAITLIVYFDSWPHHLIVLTPFLIIFILINKNFKYYNIIRFVHHLLAIIVVITWGIFYITYEFFPFNLGGLILLILLYFTLFFFYKQQ